MESIKLIFVIFLILLGLSVVAYAETEDHCRTYKNNTEINIFGNYREYIHHVNTKPSYFHSYRYTSQSEYDNVNYGLKWEIVKMLEYNEYYDQMNEGQKRYANFLLKGIFIFSPYNFEALIVPCPKIKLNDLLRPHSLNDKAIKWPNGKGRYFINGVFFDKITHDKVAKRKIRPKEILKLSNIERRYTAIQLYDVKTLLEDLDSKLINKSKNRDNELYQINLENKIVNWDDKTNERTESDLYAKCVKYKCPSTNRVYLSFVPDKIKTADQAMSWKFHITPKEYEGLKIEA